MDGFEVVLNLRKPRVDEAQSKSKCGHEQQNGAQHQVMSKQNIEICRALGLRIIHRAAPGLSRSRSRFVPDHHGILHLLEQLSHGRG